MSWMKERDALLAQTLAFVQSVAGSKGAAATGGSGLATAQPAKPHIEPAKVQAAPIESAEIAEPMPAVPVPRPSIPSSSEMQNEIRSRVASFRAHQERFIREREQYFSTTLAKLRAALNEPLPPHRPEK
jgi:hypothetical protein